VRRLAANRGAGLKNRNVIAENAMSQGALRPATHARHYEQAPDVVERDGAPTWITRSGNFIAVITDAKAGTALDRRHNPDEAMLVLAPGVGAMVEAEGESPLAWQGAQLSRAIESFLRETQML
jgi:hypothetical protein